MEINDASPQGEGRHEHREPPERRAQQGDPRLPFGLLLYTVLTGTTPATRSSRGGAHRARRGQSRGA